MLKLLLILVFMIFGALEAMAVNPAIIFGSGGYAKTIPANGIELSNGVKWIQLSADPSSSATDAPQGSFGSFGANIYIKQDNGSSTNWDFVSTGVGYSSPLTTRGDILTRDASSEIRLPLGANGEALLSDGTDVYWGSVAGTIPLLGKGSIITSDGVANGEFTACNDDEILVFDAAESSGVKCSAVPSTSPTTTEGDLILRGAAVDERLAIGATGEALLSDGTTAYWGSVAGTVPLLGKGSILTSDGVANGELTACNDDEILVFDAAETSGIKCSAVPSPSPTTTEGDLIVRGAAVDERLAIGAAGTVVKSNGTTLEYDSPPYVGLLGKGSIITSDGATNGEFTSCADGEILEYDAAEATGIKCVTKPDSGATNLILSSGTGIQAGLTNGAFATVSGLSASITTTGGSVEIFLVGENAGNFAAISPNGGSLICRNRRGATVLSQYVTPTGVSAKPFAHHIDETPAAGTYTYDVQCYVTAGNYAVEYLKLALREIK